MKQRATVWSGVAVIALVIGLGTACVQPDSRQSNTFPLVGKHEPLDCFACHGDLPYGMVPNDCSGCHIGARPNPHYDGECDQCHQPTSWLDLHVDHSFYPLVDSHATAPCASCHADGYVNTPNTCSACHEATRPAVHDPGDCGTCHQPTRWSDVSVDHSFFPLAGGHRDLACTRCHTGGTYQGLSSTCEGCHRRPGGHPSGPCDNCHTIYDFDDD